MGKEQQRKLGRRVRKLRDANTWTQDDVAQRAGVSPKTVSNIENGANVRPTTVCDVLAVFGDDGADALRDTGYDDWADAVQRRIEDGYDARVAEAVRRVLNNPDLLDRILREDT